MSALYFARPEVSNSDMLSLRRAIYGIDDPYSANGQALQFGSLVDAMLTTPHLVDHERRYLNDNGVIIMFNEQDFALALRLYKLCEKDPVIMAFVRGGVGQHEFYRTLQFEFEGYTYSQRCRCKFDTIKKEIETGADYKTTACTSLKSFKASIEFFGYDQQGSFYMDLARTNRHWIIAISKKTGEIFKYVIERGDAAYLRGREKYSYWLYRWMMLIDNFTMNTNPLPHETRSLPGSKLFLSSNDSLERGSGEHRPAFLQGPG